MTWTFSFVPLEGMASFLLTCAAFPDTQLQLIKDGWALNEDKNEGAAVRVILRTVWVQIAIS